MYDFIGDNLFWFLIVPSIVLAIYGIIIFLIDKDKNLTISECIGKTKKRSLVFALVGGLTSIPAYLTMIFWLGPSRGLSIWFQLAVTFAAIGVIILLAFPHKKDSHKIHYIGANLWSYMILIAYLMILFSGHTTLVEKIFLIQFIVSGAIISVLLFFNKLGRFTFILEAFGLANFAVTLLILAF